MIKKCPGAKGFLELAELYDYEVRDNSLYDINIVGWRNTEAEVNKFEDWIAVYRKTPAGIWVSNQWRATTRPGLHWLLKPLNRKGTAIVAPGQYKKVYALGYHRSYPALRQVGNLRVYRDNDLDKMLDEIAPEVGLFGIHIHKAGLSSKLVGKWSAGCQVIAKKADFDAFLGLCKESQEFTGKLKFNYTLLEY